MNDPLDTSAFLSRALSPPPRSRRRRADREALAEVLAEEAKLTAPSNRPPHQLKSWDHWTWNGEPDHWTPPCDPLSREDQWGLAERLQIWALWPGERTRLVSHHRVGPMKLYDLPTGTFPAEYQLEHARTETLRVALLNARQALTDGATRVEIRSYRRKPAASRYRMGQVLTNLVGVYTDANQTTDLGEPSEKALRIDAEFSG